MNFIGNIDSSVEVSLRLPVTRQVTQITAAAPGVLYRVPQGSEVKIYPTSPGTASVYSSGSPKTLIETDTTNAMITGSTHASWDQWQAGVVAVETFQQAIMPQMAVACVVVSGVWTMEICT
jgi:hypothetical protein